MPTFTTISLDRFIEPKPKSMAAGKNGRNSRQEGKTIDRKHLWTQISPALYTTPEPTPLPDSPSSFAPSPYIVNHKRRGPRLALNEDAKTDEIERSLEAEDFGSLRVIKIPDNASSSVERNHPKFVFHGDIGNNKIGNDDAAEQDNLKPVMVEGESEVGDFFDPRDSLSVRSGTDGESNGFEQSLNLNSSISEFYDAWEELSSESGSEPPPNDVETELRELRLSLLLEMEKRKQAEEGISEMRSQWGRIREKLSLVGLNLPADPFVLEDERSNEPAEDLCHQVHLIRFVSNSIGRGVAKAEIEAEMEARLESKSFEIARLLDKLRYYEAVNHEMSQRNQETIETTRSLRQRRKRRQRWIWGSIVVAVTLGSAVMAWSYSLGGKGSSSTNPSPSHTSEGRSRSAR